VFQQHLQQANNMLSANQPIGIFDSGIGGLTVANAVLRVLPDESIIYFGDTAHLPYGDKSPDTIARYAHVITDFLLSQHCKLIIIACNSASSVAYEKVREQANAKGVEVVNVIDPVVAFIAERGYRSVGVIGTRATIGSGVFPQKIAALDRQMEVSSLATPLLAPMIESGFVKGDISRLVIENYLDDPKLEGIEALILACTHYPLIKAEIENHYAIKGLSVDILATNEIVADYVKSLLKKLSLIHQGMPEPHQFYVSDYTESFEQTTRLFYKQAVHLEQSAIFSGENAY
jgi:glutamate racemase